MRRRFEALRQQLENAEQNLFLIQGKKAQYVHPTDIPLPLLKDEIYWKDEIARLQGEFKALKQEVTDLEQRIKDLEEKAPRIDQQIALLQFLLNRIGIWLSGVVLAAIVLGVLVGLLVSQPMLLWWTATVTPTQEPSSATPLPQEPIASSGKIAFVSGRDGNENIYVMDNNSSNQTRLTDNPARDFLPAWSPDGSRIAFVSERDGNQEIYVMDADGGNLRRLTENPGADEAPAWSPDGSRIAFASHPNTDWDIFVIDADGSNLMQLTDDSEADQAPAWSPDGTRIAFESKRDGNFNIYVMDADGSNQRPLTDDLAWDIGPVWSPDGTRIAFESDRLFAGEDPNHKNYNIYVMDADGRNVERLTDDSANDWQPAWSPDGTRIVFHSERDGNFNIYVMDADGTNQTRLTDHPAGDFSPTWGP